MRKLRLNVGWIVVVLLSLIPILIWSLTPKIEPAFGSFQSIIISLGEILGLAGIVMFALNLILAARWAFIERLFSGLNNVYQKHSLLGQAAFILLLFHPLLLIPRYSTDFKEAASFLFFSGSWARNFGIIALWTMVILIILTLYSKLKYNIWKISHKFLGAALFLGGLHAYLIPAYIMKNTILKAYVLTFVILGIAAFLYRSVLGKFLIKKYEYIVENTRQLNNDVVEITLLPQKGRIKFKPGQFIFISFYQKGLPSESHPFSISSGPDDSRLKITVKILGDYTEKLSGELQKGTVAKIEGPYGSFSYRDCLSKDQIWIAGGVGITPFISFVKSLKNGTDYFIKLYYCVKNKDKAVYLNFLKKAESYLNNNFQVNEFYSEEKGHISTEYLRKNTANLDKKDIFICAPPKMIEELRKGLISIGIKEDKIHSEEFSF